jgi:hypothetical protein
VRRALLAGGAVWLLVGGALGVAMAGQGGRASATGVLVGLSAGSLVASLWLLLALALDLATRRPTPRRRVRWTYVVAAVAMLSPLLAISAATLPR